MLPAAGFVDVVAVTHAWGSWRASVMASQANELAAMPSLHMAWACWSSLAVWRVLARHRWRAVVFLYPLMVAVVVMATANHFLMDVVAGVATVALAYGLAMLLAKLLNRPLPRSVFLRMQAWVDRCRAQLRAHWPIRHSSLGKSGPAGR
jgi:membrane-associated phospholipid phosphatase